MPKLVQFNPVVGFGSTGRIVENIGRFAQRNGWESYIVYSGRPQAISKSRLLQVGSQWDVYKHALESRIFDNHGQSSKLATQKLTYILKEIKPDIFHFHNIHGYYLNYEILINFVNEYKIPIIWTFHDFWPITGHCTYFSDINCQKWQKKCFNCPKTRFYPKSYIDNSEQNYHHKKEIFSSIQELTITPVSNWAAGLVKSSFLKDKDIVTIYNGVDLEVFRPVEGSSVRNTYNLQGKKILLALATTWGERKGWSDYIALSKKISEDFVIVMIGVSKAQAKALPKNIIAIERTNDVNELIQWYSEARVVLNLSYQETFGLTTVEGFACGTPSIVYDRTASPELMTDGVGEVVRAGNIDEIIMALSKITFKDKESYVPSCLQHVRNKFNAKDRYANYLTLYEAKLNGKEF